VIGRVVQNWCRLRRRVVAAPTVALVAVIAPSGVGSAATVADSAGTTVTLDSPGAVTLDAFDPGWAR